MIAAWMVYATAITLLLCAGAAAAEYLARALGAPTRFVWVAAALVALGMSGSALATETRIHPHSGRGCRPQQRQQHLDRDRAGGDPDEFERLASSRHAAKCDSQSAHARAAGRGGVRLDAGRLGIARLDASRLERWNVALVAVWLAESTLATAYLILSFVSVLRIRRRLAVAVVDEHTVLLSDDVGPALFGLVRARIVVPRWVLTLPAAERRIILAHEQEHAAAFDPALLWGAAILLALAPWNVGLWLLCARLRLALEADCDRRVLGLRGDVRGYGELLVSVHERMTRGLMPHVAFGERRSNLERRVRRMVYRPRLVSISGAAAVLGVVVLATAAWTAPVPVVRRSGNDATNFVVSPLLSRSATRFDCCHCRLAHNMARRGPGAAAAAAAAGSAPASNDDDRQGTVDCATATAGVRCVRQSRQSCARPTARFSFGWSIART